MLYTYVDFYTRCDGAARGELMSPKSSLSYSAAVILQAIASGYVYGFDVMDITGLPSGTVYPALRRMEDAGLVDSKWENEAAAQREGRPVRKYYEISASGREALNEALKRYRYMERLLPASGRKSKPSTERG
jgi:PadR family transcriptional regulator, regulatory protein PadR